MKPGWDNCCSKLWPWIDKHRSAAILIQVAAFKSWLIGISVLRNIFHTITPPPPICAVAMKQVGSMDSYCFGELVPFAASAFLYIAERNGTRLLLLLQYVVHSEILFCLPQLHRVIISTVLYSNCSLSDSLKKSGRSLFTSTNKKVFLITEPLLTGWFFFLYCIIILCKR